ncbi:MAG: ABC transporter permease subunit [Bacteroidales bacterium]|nr:ABC transporter permease subunit [Bacteroidales bacterium]
MGWQPFKAGQVDAVITAYPAALNISKHNSDLTLIAEPVDYENTAVAMGREDTTLLRTIDSLITALRQDGTFKDMQRRWLKKDFSPYETVEIAIPEEGEPLKIGTSATREPFCFIDENQKITGHDGEFALRIAAALNRPVKFLDMKFSALIPALQSGKVDMIVAGMTATEERAKSVNFSQPYFRNSQVMIVRTTEQQQVQQAQQGHKMKVLDDIADKTVGVYAGTIHDAFVEKHYPEATIRRYNTPADIIMALKMDKIDVAFLDLVSAKVMLKSNPEIGILSENALSLPVAAGFSHKNPALRGEFNRFLKEIRADGTYDTIYQRWFVEDPEEAVMPVFSYSEEDPKITLATAVGDLPNSAIVNNEHVGFDIEMLKTFARRKGYNLIINTMEFGSLVAALSSGKADIIADGLAITDERKKYVAFSDSYNTFKTGVLALTKNLYQNNNEDKVISAEKTKTAMELTFLQDIAESFYSNIIHEKRYILILNGLKVTIIISILATLLGTLLGGLICFMKMSKNRLMQTFSSVYISVLRGTPVLVVLMIIFYVVFASVDIDPVTVAILAFGLNFAAYVSEMFRTGIESIDRGQTEAGIALGFTESEDVYPYCDATGCAAYFAGI